MRRKIRVRDYMSPTLLTFTPDMDVLEAIRLMLEKGVTGAPVVDNIGTLIGMLTEKDCMQVALNAGYYDEWGGPVSKFMHEGIVTVEADLDIVEVAERLRTARHRAYPVLHENRLVGRITRLDILRALIVLSREAGVGKG